MNIQPGRVFSLCLSGVPLGSSGFLWVPQIEWKSEKLYCLELMQYTVKLSNVPPGPSVLHITDTRSDADRHTATAKIKKIKKNTLYIKGGFLPPPKKHASSYTDEAQERTVRLLVPWKGLKSFPECISASQCSLERFRILLYPVLENPIYIYINN